VVAVFHERGLPDFLSNRSASTASRLGVLYWLGDPNLPLGQPNSLPLTRPIAAPGLGRSDARLDLRDLFPFLLCPVYIAFLSRMQLAWSLDRQVPEWSVPVSERLRAPANAIAAALVAAACSLCCRTSRS